MNRMSQDSRILRILSIDANRLGIGLTAPHFQVPYGLGMASLKSHINRVLPPCLGASVVKFALLWR